MEKNDGESSPKVMKMDEVITLEDDDTGFGMEEPPPVTITSANKDQGINISEPLPASFIYSVQLPTRAWSLRPFSFDRDETRATYYEMHLSPNGLPLPIKKTAQVNVKENTIVYHVSGRPIIGASTLPVRFDSAKDLEDLLRHYHQLPLCPGVKDQAYQHLADKTASNGVFIDGVWRSLWYFHLYHSNF